MFSMGLTVCFASLFTSFQLVIASTAKVPTPSLGPSSTGLSRSVVPPFPLRPSNSSQVLSSITAVTGRLPTPISTNRILVPVCDYSRAPVRFPIAEITASPFSAKTNDELFSELKAECSLWDSLCSGNKAVAAKQFFEPNGTWQYLFGGPWSCFGDGSLNCSTAFQSEIAQLKDWMRTTECNSMKAEEGDPKHLSCCVECSLTVGNVDVYYWPEPDVDTSCLSIVGDSIHPAEYGATLSTVTGSTVSTYWGCTTQLPGCGTKGYIQTITTATMFSMNSVSWKSYIYNPWGPQPCPETAVTPTSSMTAPRSPFPLHARAHSILNPSSATGRNGSRISTAVSGSFTLWVS